MLIDNSGKHPFTGAGSVFSTPIPPNNFDPKTWGDDGLLAEFSNTIFDPNVDFVADGIAVDDPVFIMFANPLVLVATTVFLVLGPNAIDINFIADKDYFQVLYKVGEKAQHTFRSLIEIIVERGLQNYTVHWARCWTRTPFPDFQPDEFGDVYIIDPEEERKLNGKNRVNHAHKSRPTIEELTAAPSWPSGPT